MTDVWFTTSSNPAEPEATHGLLFPHFTSVYESGYAAGFAIGLHQGDRAAREDCTFLIDAAIRAGLQHTGRPRELTAVDALAVIGDPARARQAQDAVDEQRLRWWRAEEQHLQRCHLREVDAVEQAHPHLRRPA